MRFKIFYISFIFTKVSENSILFPHVYPHCFHNLWKNAKNDSIFSYSAKICFNISFTMVGLAFPFIAFIVCPTRNPIAFSLPFR